MPVWLKIMLFAATPFGEVRLALPLALAVYKLPVWLGFLLSLAGNILAVVFIFFALHCAGRWSMEHIPLVRTMLTRVFARTHRAFSGRYAAWGLLGLALFVAVPLPLTGGWTGAAAAYLFGFKKGPAVLALITGVTLASFAVLILTVGIQELFTLRS